MLGRRIKEWERVAEAATASLSLGQLDGPHPNGAVMSFVLIWLIVSVVCAGVVLLAIKFAPSWDDEPLDSNPGSSTEPEERSQPQDESPTVRQEKTRDIQTVVRSDLRIDPAPSGPNLADFVIVRTDDRYRAT